MFIRVGFICLALALSGVAGAEVPKAAPLGLELGVTSCPQGIERIAGVPVPTAPAGVPTYVARSPCQLFPRATRVQLQCTDGKVSALKISLSKGGAGSPVMFEVFKSLRQKYELLQGKAPTELDGACVTFKSQEGLVKLDATVFTDEVSVEYLLESVERQRQTAGL